MMGEKPWVRLRALEPEDLNFLYEIENDELIWNVGLTNVPYSKSLLLDYITSSSGDIFADKQVRMIVVNEQGEDVGMVDLIDFSPAHQRAELGLVIKSEFRRHGYATATLVKMKDYCRNIVHLHQIYAIVPQNNIACSKMLENVGFQRVRSLKEWLYDGESYHDADFFQIFL